MTRLPGSVPDLTAVIGAQLQLEEVKRTSQPPSQHAMPMSAAAAMEAIIRYDIRVPFLG
jgi:hypothetical protein